MRPRRRRLSLLLLAAVIVVGTTAFLRWRDFEIVDSEPPTGAGAGPLERANSAASPSSLAVPPSESATPARSGDERSGDSATASEAVIEPRQRQIETHVEFVDAMTGTPVPGCAIAAPGAATPGAWMVTVIVPIVVSATDAQLPKLLMESRSRFAPSLPSANHRDVILPSGYVIAARSSDFVPLARHATSFRIVQPVHRELPVRITFVDGNDRPVRDVTFASWRVGNFRCDEPIIDADSSGAVRVRCVPFVPGATFAIAAFRHDAQLRLIEANPIEEPHVGPMEHAWKTRIPSSLDEGIDARVVPASINDMGMPDHNETDNDLAPDDAPGIQRGRVRVDVRDRAGRPIEGASVFVDDTSRLTDDRGFVIADGVPAGSRTVTAREIGYLFAPVVVTVVGGAEARVTLTEIAGATLDLVVVDADGVAAPFATIAIRPASGPAWADVDDSGEQRFDPFTDVRGRRTCHRVAPGRVRVEARFGDGVASAVIDALDGQRKSLRLELR